MVLQCPRKNIIKFDLKPLSKAIGGWQIGINLKKYNIVEPLFTRSVQRQQKQGIGLVGAFCRLNGASIRKVEYGQ